MPSDAQGRRSGGFPTEQPLEALIADHRFVKQLFEHYLGSSSMEVKKEASREALILVQAHSALEESVFYPAVQEADAQLINHCQQEHQKVDQLVEQIKSMHADDPRFDELFRQIATSVTHHIDEEEQQLFPKVEQAKLDLKTLGTQMQQFEANMVATQARQSS